MSSSSLKSGNNFIQAFWLSISNASSIFVSLISVAILSRYFNKIEYGTYKQIIFIYSTLLTVFQAGLPNVFSYFLPKYSHEEGKYIVKKINNILIVLGILLSLSIFVLAKPISLFLNNPDLSSGLKLFSPFPMFVLPTLGIEGIYIVNKNTKFIAIYNTITRFIMLIFITVPVIFISNRYESAIIGWGIASIFAFLIALRYKNKPYSNVKREIQVDHLFKKVANYSIPLLGSACILLLYNSINQILISKYYGISAFADYSNGYIPLPFIAILVNPIRNLFIPIFSKAKSENYFDDSIISFNNAIKELGILIIPACIFCFTFSKEIMLFLYGKQYESSYLFFMLAITYNIFEILPFQIVLSGIGKTKELMIFDITSTIVLITTDLVLIQHGISSPIIIAMCYTIMQIILRNIVPLIYIYKVTKIKILRKKTISTLTVIFTHCIIVGFITYFITKQFALLIDNLVLKLLISGILFYCLTMTTGKILNINYIHAIYKLLSKKMNNEKQ